MNESKDVPSKSGVGECELPKICWTTISERLDHNEDRIQELLEYSHEHLVEWFDALNEAMKLGDDASSLERLVALGEIAVQLDAKCLKASTDEMFGLIQNVATSGEVNSSFAKVKTALQGTLLSLKEAMGKDAVTAPDLATKPEE